MSIRLDASGLLNGLSKMEFKVQQGTRLYAETAATKMINYAKKNAPWDDDTGNSRGTMDYEVTNKGKSVEIKLRGNTPHFKYLELAMEKRYAILFPTIKRWKGEVLSGWAKVVSK